MAPQCVVITALAGMGNSIMTIPMVRQLKRAWPNCRITVLARTAAMGEPLRRMPEVEEVLLTGLGIKALLRNIRWMSERKPDLFLVPFPSNRWHYSLLALTSGAKRKVLHSYPVGYWRALHFIGDRTPAEKGVHDVIQNLRLLRMLGIEPDESDRPTFDLSDADRAAGAKLLRDIGLNETANFIAVHAGGGSYHVLARAKRWPAANYAALLDSMKTQFNMPIVLLEGPDEAGVADEIRKHLKFEVCYLKLSGPLAEAAAVLQRAQLYVGSDSGLAHLASAVGTRAVTIFAPADPDRVCPFGNRDLVVQPDKGCSPCYTYPFITPYNHCKCREPFCIDSIPVSRVLDAVQRAFAK